MVFIDAIDRVSKNRFAIQDELEKHVDSFKSFFVHLCPQRRKTIFNPVSCSLTRFTINSIDSILVLIPDHDEKTIISILETNFNLNLEKTKELYDKIIHLYQNKIKFLYKEMINYRDGLLSRKKYKEVIELYRRLLKPKYYEKKNRGEVFTPFECIKRILDQIPMTVWTNCNSTFFDPSAGIGGFLVIAYMRLMSTLTQKIKNPIHRHDHIIKKMLFAAEIDTLNVNIMKKVFGKGSNIFKGDTLTGFDSLKAFGRTDFHVVFGNPPFKKPQKKDIKRNGGDSLWPDFVESSYKKWLTPLGYFGMLLPPGWRKPSDNKSRSKNLWKTMALDNTITWIEMYDIKEARKIFDDTVSIRFDLVVGKKEDDKKFKTVINGYDGEIVEKSIKKYPYLPNGNLNHWIFLFELNEPKCEVFYSRSIYDPRRKNVKREKDKEYKYPVIHAIHKDGKPVILYTNKSKPEGGFGKPKIIFNRLGQWNQPILDLEGRYGLSESAFALLVSSKKEGIDLQNYFNKETLKMFSMDMQWATSTPNIFWKLFKDLPKNFYLY